VPDFNSALRALININQVFLQTDFTEGMLTGSGERVRNVILADGAKYSDALNPIIRVVLHLLIVLVLVFTIFVRYGLMLMPFIRLNASFFSHFASIVYKSQLVTVYSLIHLYQSLCHIID